MTTARTRAPAQDLIATPETPGVYVVSVRRDADREATRRTTYAHVGLSADTVANQGTIIADAFTATGFGLDDLTDFIEGLHALAVDPGSLDIDSRFGFVDRSGVDSEGSLTDVYIFALGSKRSPHNFLVCAEAVHATWPRLLSVIGASVSGTIAGEADESGAWRHFSLPGITTPKSLRLKSGWDLDAEGHQVWLPMDEAWRRFVEHDRTRERAEGDDQDKRMDARTLRRVRRHMKGFYDGQPTTRRTTAD